MTQAMIGNGPESWQGMQLLAACCQSKAATCRLTTCGWLHNKVKDTSASKAGAAQAI